jgi:aldose 1-epimerase
MPIELHNDFCRVFIYPEYGGMLNNFFVKKNDSEVDIMLGYDSDDSISEKIHQDFRGVKLSPYPNRIKGGVYIFDEVTHQLILNFMPEENSIHGLLYDKHMNVLLQRDTKLIFSYLLRADEFKGYPFTYYLRMEYELIDRALICKTFIKNIDSRIIPIADGFHPYFKIGSTVDLIKLKLPHCDKLLLDEEGIPTGIFASFSKFSELSFLGTDQFDDCFLISGGDFSQVILELDDIQITVRQETGNKKYNYLQIYTPTDRKSIAIEPMTAAPNGFNNQMSLIQLKPWEEMELSYQISVS